MTCILCLEKYKTKILSFLVLFIITFVFFVIVQPKQGHSPKIGFTFKVYDKDTYCYHIHHWVYMLTLSLFTIIIVLLSQGTFNEIIMAILGFLIGGSMSDLVYKDFYKFIVKC